jgi:tyrocidine synthetase-3
MTRVIQAILQNASNNPEHIAIYTVNANYTYSQLIKESMYVALYLNNNYVLSPGQIIIQIVRKGYHMIVGIIAILLVNCTYCPIHPDEPKEKICHIINSINPVLIILEEELDIDFIQTKDIFKYSMIHQVGISNTLYQSMDICLSHEINDPILYIIHTSGTTGYPKAIPIKESGFMSMIQSISRTEVGYVMNKISIQLSRCTFDVHVLEILGTLIKGGTLVIPKDTSVLDISHIQELLFSYRVYTLDITPSLILQLLNPQTLIFPDVRVVALGGESSSSELFHLIRKAMPNAIRIINLYGPAECTINCFAFTLENTMDIPDIIPIGTVLDDFFYHISEEDELLIRGYGVMNGYIDPSLNASAFTYLNGDLYYNTGDLVELRSKNLYFIGRKDQQVKLNGQRIELQSIEHSICQFNTIILNSLVEVSTDSSHTSFLKAYLHIADLPECLERGQGDPANGDIEQRSNSREGHCISTSFIIDLINYCRQKYPLYMIPSMWYTVSTFFTTPNGKMDRKKIPESTLVYPTILSREELNLNTIDSHSIVKYIRSCLDISNTISLDENLLDTCLLQSFHLFTFVQRMTQVYPSFHPSIVTQHSTIRSLYHYITNTTKSNDYQLFLNTTQDLTQDDKQFLIGSYRAENGIDFLIWEDEQNVFIQIPQIDKTKSIVRKQERRYYVCFTLDPYTPIDYRLLCSRNQLYLRSKEKYQIQSWYINNLKLYKI